MLSAIQGLMLIPVGCFSSAAGLILMKASVDDAPDIPPWRNPRWILGFALLGVVSTVVQVLVIAVLPLSVVAPFAGLTIVFSLLLAASGWLTKHSEALTGSDIVATCLVLLGVTLVSAYGPHGSSTAPTLVELVNAYARPQFALLIAVTLAAAAARLLPTLYRHCPTWLAPLLCAFASSVCGCVSQLFLKLLSTAAPLLPESTLHVAFALAGLACSAPLHLKLLNLTLAGAAVSISVPCYQFLLILTTTAAGGLLFDEFAGQAASTNAVYALGVCVAAAGLVVLSRGTPPSDDVLDEDITSEAELEGACEGGDHGDLGDSRSACGSDAPSSLDAVLGGDDDAGAEPPPLPPPRLMKRRSTFRGSLALATKRSSFVVGGIGTGLGSLAAVLEARELSRGVDADASTGGRSRSNTWSHGLEAMVPPSAVARQKTTPSLIVGSGGGSGGKGHRRSSLP